MVDANVAMLLEFVWHRSQPCGLRVNVHNTYILRGRRVEFCTRQKPQMHI